MVKTKNGVFIAAVLMSLSAPAWAQTSKTPETQGAVQTAATAQAAPDADRLERARLAGACLGQLGLSEAGCVCFTERAVAELSNLQRDYLLATAIAPRAAERIGRDVKPADLQSLAKFIDAVGQVCAGAK